MIFDFLTRLRAGLAQPEPDAEPETGPEPATEPKIGRCVLILGMHRSGTSALAGSFREAGLYMGRVLDHSFGLNPKGLQEPSALVYMHENLLEANGGAWHEPPEQITWQPLHRSVRDLFIDSRRGEGAWGFKEPRTLLVAQDWIEVLPDWTGAGIFRDPREVALSIQGRNGFDLEKGFHIWNAYNRSLLQLHRNHGVPVMEFVSDPEAMRAGISRLIAHTGLTPPERPAFFDASIPRNSGKAPDLQIPAEVAQTLAALREAARAK